VRQFNNPLFDVEFLKQLTEKNNREVYARIISLTFQEEPIEQIQGRVTQGSVNIDGASAVRRTCSLTLVAKDLNINDFYWGLKTKFKLEIGVKNDINSDYEEIIWFPQGTYVITSFNTSQSTNNYTIQIQGKDKMCLLNGELGGNLPASIDFGTIETYDVASGIVKIDKLVLKQIIREALHTYALEPYHNIIINDLDEAGMELLEYRGENALYLLYDVDIGEFEQVQRKADSIVYVDGVETAIGSLEHYLILADQIEVQTPTKFTLKDSSTVYYAAKLTFGDTAGYRITDLTYAGDLISSIGESITSAVLDKIKNMLGEFEYFYDIDGRFIFQKKKTYINQPFHNEVNDGDGRYIADSAYNTRTIYQFEGGNLVTSYRNNPMLTDLKNDYSIWGVRKSLTGAEIPIHLRYAIDIKPTQYTSIDGVLYSDDDYDWREIIYQMSVDFYKHGQDENFLYNIIDANKADELYTDGTTGYEQYYLDLNGFWRELYDPNKEEWNDNNHWNPLVAQAPDQLNFWFDFLHSGELEQFSVQAIGDRTKVVNDNNIKSIYFRDVPEIIYIGEDKSKEMELIDLSNSWHYTRIQGLPMTLFNISAQGKSAYDTLEELMYQHSYCSESITLTTVPVYHLEPNTRIFVYDDSSKINGEYIVSKLSIPLAYNGTMSITATKAPTRLY
jgi:hypothetical protein